MKVSFRAIELPGEEAALTEWLSAHEWPFHGNSRLSPEKIKEMLAAGTFTGSNHRCFWILSPANERAGYIRLFDLDDIGDGTPLFDLRLHPDFRGRGIGLQALTWLTNYFFETWPELDRIEGNTRVDNLAMRKIFRKCHYVKEGHNRQAWAMKDGRKLDSIHYGILRGDWQKQSATPVPWNDEPL